MRDRPLLCFSVEDMIWLIRECYSKLYHETDDDHLSSFHFPFQLAINFLVLSTILVNREPALIFRSIQPIAQVVRNIQFFAFVLALYMTDDRFVFGHR